jgi:hypothetical protein
LVLNEGVIEKQRLFFLSTQTSSKILLPKLRPYPRITAAGPGASSFRTAAKKPRQARPRPPPGRSVGAKRSGTCGGRAKTAKAEAAAKFRATFSITVD